MNIDYACLEIWFSSKKNNVTLRTSEAKRVIPYQSQVDETITQKTTLSLFIHLFKNILVNLCFFI